MEKGRRESSRKFSLGCYTVLLYMLYTQIDRLRFSEHYIDCSVGYILSAGKPLLFMAASPCLAQSQETFGRCFWYFLLLTEYCLLGTH